MTWIEAIFGKVSSRGGSALELQGTINFASPLVATLNPAAERIDVSLVQGDMTTEVASYLDFPVVEVPAWLEGRVYYANGELNVCSDVSGDVMPVNKGLQFDARNNTGSSIAKAVPICVTGAIGGNPTIGLASNTNDATFVAIGLTKQVIANNSVGPVITEGVLTNVNTNSWEEGELLYVGSTPGTLTNVLPPGTSYYAAIGQVLVKHPTAGAIGVHPRRKERLAGTTANRPTAVRIGDPYFNTTTKELECWDGSGWGGRWPPYVGIIDGSHYSPRNPSAAIHHCTTAIFTSDPGEDTTLYLDAVGAELGDVATFKFLASASFAFDVYDVATSTTLATVAVADTKRTLTFVFCTVAAVDQWVLLSRSGTAGT